MQMHATSSATKYGSLQYLLINSGTVGEMFLKPDSVRGELRFKDPSQLCAWWLDEDLKTNPSRGGTSDDKGLMLAPHSTDNILAEESSWFICC